MTTLFVNIKSLVNIRNANRLLRGNELQELPSINDAYLLVEDNVIADFGPMDQIPGSYLKIQNPVDAAGRLVLPSWCDSHTHLVFAGSREGEFIDKIRGLSYAEIAAKGGGILHSAKVLNETSEDLLYNQAYGRLQELIKLGTGAIEIKSGYGLTVEGELKNAEGYKAIESLQQDTYQIYFFRRSYISSSLQRKP